MGLETGIKYSQMYIQSKRKKQSYDWIQIYIAKVIYDKHNTKVFHNNNATTYTTFSMGSSCNNNYDNRIVSSETKDV